MDEIIQEMARQIIYKEEDYPCGKKGRYLPPKRQKKIILVGKRGDTYLPNGRRALVGNGRPEPSIAERQISPFECGVQIE
jgi:hypothetical protein